MWIFGLRVLASLIILRFPLFGGLFAIVFDYFDLQFLGYFNDGDLSSYQQADKIADICYLAIEALIVWRFWQNKWMKRITLFTFFYRLIGVFLFEYTQQEYLLLVFPNIFEYLFLTYLIMYKWLKRDVFVKAAPIFALVISLTTIKVFHEYLLHINTTHPWIRNKYVSRIIDPDFVEQKIEKPVEQAIDTVKP